MRLKRNQVLAASSTAMGGAALAYAAARAHYQFLRETLKGA